MNPNQTKTAAVSGVVGALLTIILAALSHYGITVTQEVSGAIFTLLVAAAGWLAHRDAAASAATPTTAEVPHE